jgi:hypothetical protein
MCVVSLREVNHDASRNLHTDIVFCRFVMQELVDTENDYVKDLGLVVDVSIQRRTDFV